MLAATTENFRAAIRERLGVEPPAAIGLERFSRFPTNRDPRDDAGYAKLVGDGTAGVFGDFRTGRHHVWQAKRDRPLTEAERRALQERIEQARREAEELREREAEAAAERARRIWSEAEPAHVDHPYLQRKAIRAHGVRLYRGDLVIGGMPCDGALVIALRDAAGEIWSLEFIGADGQKRFLPGGRTAGAYAALGAPGETIVICEGWATGAAIHEATGFAARCAMSAGNLLAVAQAIRTRAPQARIIIAADNDASGVGQKAAAEAARAVGGLVALPPKAGSDWCDVRLVQGNAAVKAGIEAAKAPEPETPRVDRPQLVLRPIGELLAEPQPQTRWLVEGMLPAAGLSVLAARPKVGKSTLARCLAMRVARGKPFLGRAVAQGPVFILDLEGKRGETIEALRRLGACGSDPIKVFCGVAPEGALDELREAALRERPALIVVDTFQRLARVSNLNDYAEVSNTLDAFISLARDTGAHLMLLHHQGRAEAEGVDAPMGSTAVAGSVDTILTMRRRKDEAGTRTLATVQRYGDDLPETVLLLGPNGEVEAGGTLREHEERDAERRILDYLAEHPGAEVAEIRESVEGRWATVWAALKRLQKAGRISTTGSGRKGDPLRFSAVADSCFSCSPCSREQREQENTNFGAAPRPDSPAGDPAAEVL